MRARRGACSSNVIIIPMRKTQEWWGRARSNVTRISIRTTARTAQGEGARDARPKPDQHDLSPAVLQPGRQRRPGRVRLHHLLRVRGRAPAGFEQICRTLRDVEQNPEWRYVVEGRNGGAGGSSGGEASDTAAQLTKRDRGPPSRREWN